MRLKLAVSSVAVSLAFAACTRPFGTTADGQPALYPHQSSRIVGGTADTGDPAVVVISYSGTTGDFLCTGILIAPTVVLTAGHCTLASDTCVEANSNCTTLPASGFSVGVGNVTTALDDILTVTDVHTDPDYDGTTLAAGTGSDDLGILILASQPEVNGVLVAPTPYMAPTEEGDSTAYNPGANITSIGFGESTSGSSTTAGTKRTAALQIANASGVTSQYIFAFSGATRDVCSGDSGGPAIESIDGVNVVIGTTSYGDANCDQFGADMRTDASSQYTFISTYATPAPLVTPTPTPTASASASPTPTATPASSSKKSSGCNVAGAELAPGGTLLACLLGAMLVAARRRRRA